MEKELLEALQVIMDNMATKADIQESETRTKVFIENMVSKKLDALTDGYKLTHEKQWELEHRLEKLEQRLSELENRTA